MIAPSLTADRVKLIEQNVSLAESLAIGVAQSGRWHDEAELVGVALDGLWRAAANYRPECGKFRNFANRCIRRAIFFKISRSKQPADTLGDELDSEIPETHNSGVVPVVSIDQIEAAVKSLPDIQREMVTRRYGLCGARVASTSELAEEYSMTPRNAQIIIQAARVALRAKLAEAIA
jgi:RNA polymerase sigma factor (sigma-70 family)